MLPIDWIDQVFGPHLSELDSLERVNKKGIQSISDVFLRQNRKMSLEEKILSGHFKPKRH
jgi:hypothetical protein